MYPFEPTTIGGITYRHVQQREGWDCGIACLAMLTGEKYEHILYNMEHNWSGGSWQPGRGISEHSAKRALVELGFKGVMEMRSWSPSYPCLITVPSLNFKAKNHFCVWLPGIKSGHKYDGVVLDPQAGREGLEGYTEELIWDGAVSCSLMIFGD